MLINKSYHKVLDSFDATILAILVVGFLISIIMLMKVEQ